MTNKQVAAKILRTNLGELLSELPTIGASFIADVAEKNRMTDKTANTVKEHILKLAEPIKKKLDNLIHPKPRKSKDTAVETAG